MLRPMFREGFACIFVVCLSAMSTMHIIGVDSVVLQASNGVSTLKQTSWNGELCVCIVSGCRSLHWPNFFYSCLGSFVSLFLYILVHDGLMVWL